MLVWTCFATAQALNSKTLKLSNLSYEAFAGQCWFSFLGSFTQWWYCKISDSLVLVKVACEIWGRVCYSRGIIMPTSWEWLFFILILVRPFSACSFWSVVVCLSCKPEVETHLFTCCAAFCSWYPSSSSPRLWRVFSQFSVQAGSA